MESEVPSTTLTASALAQVAAVQIDTQIPGLLLGAETDDNDASSATSVTPASDSDVPRSILKPRSLRPPPQRPSPAKQVVRFCRRQLPLGLRCARRSGRRITFQGLVEVTEFSRAVSHDAVPGDHTDLAVGLGRPVGEGLLPLARENRPLRRVEEHCYLPIELRTRILTEAIGQKRSHKVIALHRKRMHQTIAWRAESVTEDSFLKEPHELMPTSYQQAKERAWKVAAEARAAAAEKDSLFAASSVCTSLDEISPEKLMLEVSRKKAVPQIYGKFGTCKRKHRLIATGFMARSMIGRTARLKEAV